jgi:predicted MFS family arabinose efflux permease
MIYRFFTHWRSSYEGIPKEIWFLSLITLVNKCGGMIIVFISLYLTQELHYHIREAGYTMMFFGLGGLVGAYIGGQLTDRLGSFPVQFWSLMINGVVLMLMLYIRDFGTMCGAVFFLSLISESFRPANAVAIANHCTAETRTRSISLYRMAANLGWAVAPAFGGVLVAFGWSWLFWADGLTCMIAALFLYWLLPPKPFHRQQPTNPVFDEPFERRKSPYRDRKFVWFSVLTVLNAMVFMQLIWIIPVFWKTQFGWNETTVGLMSALNGVLVFLIEMPLVHQLEGKRNPMDYVRIGLLLYAASYLCFLLPLGFTVLGLLFIFAISLGEIFVMPFSSNFVFGRSFGAYQGQYMAVYGISWGVANTLAPLYGTQVVATFGYDTLWVLLALQACIVWVGFLLLDRFLPEKTALGTVREEK